MIDPDERPVRSDPRPARTAWLRLRDGLRDILGDDLVAMWAHGGTLASPRPRQADLDTYVILARPPDAATVQSDRDAPGRASRPTWASNGTTGTSPPMTPAQSQPPAHAFRDDRIDQSWAIQRAHWLAGRYWSLHGPPPGRNGSRADRRPRSRLICVRSWSTSERHVAAGDYTDPYEATYAVLNGSRILHSLETQDVAISKREAGDWALEHLPDRWHPLLRAAIAQLRRGSDAGGRPGARRRHGAFRRHGPGCHEPIGMKADYGPNQDEVVALLKRLKAVDQPQALFLAGLANDDAAHVPRARQCSRRRARADVRHPCSAPRMRSSDG